jgi:hypothetical protein
MNFIATELPLSLISLSNAASTIAIEAQSAHAGRRNFCIPSTATTASLDNVISDYDSYDVNANILMQHFSNEITRPGKDSSIFLKFIDVKRCRLV